MWRQLLVLTLVARSSAALFEHEDHASVFEWLHAILVGMGLHVAVAASVLTFCGLRACTNGILRDSFSCSERWHGLLKMLSDDVARGLERQRAFGDEPVDKDQVSFHLETEMKHRLFLQQRSDEDAKRTKMDESGSSAGSSSATSADPWVAAQPRAVQSFVFSVKTCHGDGNHSLITCTCGKLDIRTTNFRSHLLGPRHDDSSEQPFFTRCTEIDQASLAFAQDKLRLAEETITRLQSSLEASVVVAEQQCAAKVAEAAEQLRLQRNAASYYERVAWRECVPRLALSPPPAALCYISHLLLTVSPSPQVPHNAAAARARRGARAERRGSAARAAR